MHKTTASSSWRLTRLLVATLLIANVDLHVADRAAEISSSSAPPLTQPTAPSVTTQTPSIRPSEATQPTPTETKTTEPPKSTETAVPSETPEVTKAPNVTTTSSKNATKSPTPTPTKSKRSTTTLTTTETDDDPTPKPTPTTVQPAPDSSGSNDADNKTSFFSQHGTVIALSVVGGICFISFFGMVVMRKTEREEDHEEDAFDDPDVGIATDDGRGGTQPVASMATTAGNFDHNSNHPYDDMHQEDAFAHVLMTSPRMPDTRRTSSKSGSFLTRSTANSATYNQDLMRYTQITTTSSSSSPQDHRSTLPLDIDDNDDDATTTAGAANHPLRFSELSDRPMSEVSDVSDFTVRPSDRSSVRSVPPRGGAAQRGTNGTDCSESFEL